MMGHPLTLQNFLMRSRDFFGKKEIVSRELDGTLFRYTYREFYERVCRLAHALEELGVGKGDRVGTFGWNTHRHLELYFTPCMGAVYHTINIRLFPEQIAYIINHANDRVLFIDADLVPLIEQIRDKINVQNFVIMGKEKSYDTKFDSIAYEELISGKPRDYEWPLLDEWDTAGTAYTSGTTGLPKGVEYTHRGLVLHSIVAALPDEMGLSEKDNVLHIVPMFHANAWSIPFAATMVGAKQVFPGSQPTPQVLVDLMNSEKITFTAGVPTIWLMVYQYLKQNPDKKPEHLKEVISGGSAPPVALIKAFREEFGIEIIHAYGLTETTPLVTLNRPKSYLELDDEAYYQLKTSQGLIAPLLEMRIVKEDGREVEWNGKDMGELILKGPWIAKEYFKDIEKTKEKFTEDGWFRTEDIAVIDEEGYIKIVDRVKDVIKSGGEWISSVDLENALMAHPAVAEATVIGIEHPKWQERPLAVVVRTQDVTKEELIEFLKPKFAKWWLPDDIVFIDEIPKTSVGKFDKKVLRERFKDYYMK
jgi:fatty-acyl-CoA synthase